MKRVLLGTVVAALAALGGLTAPAFAAAKQKCCVRHLHFAAGPYLVRPGANAILFDFTNVPKPNIDGYMIKASPNLHYALGKTGHLRCCGAIPRVDVIHLHHGVWLSDGRAGAGETSGGNGNPYPGFYPFMASGEEKTRYILPAGYGYPVAAKDHWIFNYMIHNLWPQPRWVYVTYDIDYVPASSALAKTLVPVHPIWMDVMARHVYPVFDVHRYTGRKGVYVFPDMDSAAYRPATYPLNQFIVDHPGVLVATAGHVHPGGLWDELDVSRTGTTTKAGIDRGVAPGSVRLFRSNAHYWDPRGPISWDMAMQGTDPSWRPIVKAGDVLSVHAAYETKRASWYESMGIMVVWEAWNHQKGGVNPFRRQVIQTGHLTHGHLAENNNHGGATKLYNGLIGQMKNCSASTVKIQKFVYNPGGFDATGKNLCIPTITQGQSLNFLNEDASAGAAFNGVGSNDLYVKSIFHTVTTCQNPCGLDTGISYPLANGAGGFDSGQLGYGTPAVGTLTWKTPTGLKPGVYTYFCRIHPFMRGVFRVIG